jgi:hypothetical protein
MRFRKKPVVIEAREWTGTRECFDDLYAWGCPSGKPADALITSMEDDLAAGLTIFTLEGTHHASLGDWIIKGVKGEFYPCKPDIFATTYEPALSSPATDEGTATRRSCLWHADCDAADRALRAGVQPSHPPMRPAPRPAEEAPELPRCPNCGTLGDPEFSGYFLCRLVSCSKLFRVCPTPAAPVEEARTCPMCQRGQDCGAVPSPERQVPKCETCGGSGFRGPRDSICGACGGLGRAAPAPVGMPADPRCVSRGCQTSRRFED